LRTLKAVFFDVGETLVDEERWWRVVAERSGLQPHVVWAALGVTIERGEEHSELWRHLGRSRPEDLADVAYEPDDLYPDAMGCLEVVRARGYLLGVAGNQSPILERWTRNAGLPVDIIGSSASWGVRKPASGFFERMVAEAGCEAEDLAYVGDRVDNDVLPALDAGIVAVHLRRGPWGRLQQTPPGAMPIDSLDELPQALASLP
jgi:HAD superfamily hydrolase (TIGR01662 family)